MAWLLLCLSLLMTAASAAIGPAWSNETANTLARTAQCRSTTNAPADVLPFSEVRRGIGDDIVRAVLCQDGSAWIYRVTTIAASGTVRTLLFDARTGAPIKP